MKFEDLNIQEDVLRAIKELGFEKPTEIQRKSMPLAIAGKDVIASSATGSGKTLAFGAGFLGSIAPGNGIQALVLTPTRELAEQIVDALKTYGKYRKLHIIPIFGGVSYNPQYENLKIADIVVGTPGRIIDHMNQKTLDLRNIKTLVLDEADRMLDMGFLDDVKKVIRKCPDNRQMLLFSATMPPDIVYISEKMMHDPIRVSAEVYVDPKKLKQVYYDVKGPDKISLLAHLLKQEDTGLVMVFCNSRRYTDIVENTLNHNGIEAMSIHGGLSQDKRSKVIKKFHAKETFVLICTDVAARGLDIPDVSHVYNFDIPDDSKQYIHRIGRTARAGEHGRVINLISYNDFDNFSRVWRDFDVDIEKMETPRFGRIKTDRPPRREGGPRRGGPRSGPRNSSNRGPPRGGRRPSSRGPKRNTRRPPQRRS